MKNNIVILGDSFTYGQGCSDKEFYYDNDLKRTIGDRDEFRKGPSKYCWASLLQAYYSKYNIINLAEPGNDNAYMLANAYKHVNDDTALLIFAGTMIPRMHVPDEFDDDRGLGPWVMGSLNGVLSKEETNLNDHAYREHKEIYHAKKYFLKYLYSEEVFSIYALNALYAAYGLAKRYNTKFMWSIYPYEDPKHIEYADNLADMKFTSATHWYRNVQAVCKSKDNHLNNLGHAFYFGEIVLPKVKEILE
jgi:hypothetical protein